MKKDISTVPYPNIMSFLKRHGLTIRDIAVATKKSYPPAQRKLNKKKTNDGKVALFDIDEANAIIDFVISTEEKYLKDRFGEETWEQEWDARWGHIHDWFKYLFFDHMVTNATK